MEALNNRRIRRWLPWMAVTGVSVFLVTSVLSQTKQAADKAKKPAERDPGPPNKSSYDQIAPVLLGQETFQERMTKDKADKPSVMARQKKLVEERYDLASRPDKTVTMSRGKPLQVGPTAKLAEGLTWE